jgi:hypothetical protein
MYDSFQIIMIIDSEINVVICTHFIPKPANRPAFSGTD